MLALWKSSVDLSLGLTRQTVRHDCRTVVGSYALKVLLTAASDVVLKVCVALNDVQIVRGPV